MTEEGGGGCRGQGAGGADVEVETQGVTRKDTISTALRRPWVSSMRWQDLRTERRKVESGSNGE